MTDNLGEGLVLFLFMFICRMVVFAGLICDANKLLTLWRWARKLFLRYASSQVKS